MVSAAALLEVSPVLAGQVSSVQAADKTTAKAAVNKKDKKATTVKTAAKKTTPAKATSSKKGTIKLSRNAYVFDKDGKRLKEYMGSSKYTTIAKGITLNYNGKKTINGKNYYSIGNGAFIKAANVGYVDGKKVSQTNTITATIKHNAYIYNGQGKTDKKKVKKGQQVTVDQLKYIGSKLFYRLGGQSDQFVKATNVGSTSSKLKPVNKRPKKNKSQAKPSDNQNDPTVITLNHNSYIYDGQGNTSKKKVMQGQQITVDDLQYIGGKLYYHVNDDKFPGQDQWIKKSNVGVITGKQLKPSNSAPDDDQSATLITLGQDAYVYNDKGIAQTTKTFAKGHTARVTELRYIWVAADNKAELFYKLQSDKNGYIRDVDVSAISGAKLTVVNTPQDAQDGITVATVSDKSDLQIELNQVTTVKASDAYKLAAKSLRDTYDSAITAGMQVNNGTSTISEVKAALSKIKAARAALNGKKIVVNDLNNLSAAEANQIVQLAASANNVDQGAVQFSNNNTTLMINGANGFQQALNISDYATTTK